MQQYGSATVEIIEQRIPAAVVARRREQSLLNLNNLGMIDAEQGQAAGVDPRGQLAGYTLKVNGVSLPVAISAYEIVATEQGPAVTVTLPASSVTVGGGTRVPETAEGRAARTWGGNQRRDPREGIPGWAPEVGND